MSSNRDKTIQQVAKTMGVREDEIEKYFTVEGETYKPILIPTKKCYGNLGVLSEKTNWEYFYIYWYNGNAIINLYEDEKENLTFAEYWKSPKKKSINAEVSEKNEKQPEETKTREVYSVTSPMSLQEFSEKQRWQWTLLGIILPAIFKYLLKGFGIGASPETLWILATAILIFVAGSMYYATLEKWKVKTDD